MLTRRGGEPRGSREAQRGGHSSMSVEPDVQPAARIEEATADDPGRQVQRTVARKGAQSTEARTAFQDLHRRYLPFTYALASRKAHPDDVEDILQETWVAAWRRLQEEEPVERFISLLEAICRHKVADANERRFRRKRQPKDSEHTGPWTLSLDDPLDASNPEGERFGDSLPGNDPSPEATAIAQAKTDELWTLLERLPENWRLAMVCRFFNGMSVLDTAKAMRTTEDAIKKYVFRAVRRMREWMQDDREFWLE